MKTIRREIFSSEIAIDGRMATMSRQERIAFVKALFENTKSVMDKGVRVAIREGHDDPNQRLRGELKNISLKKDNGTLYIMGEMALGDDLASAYESGQLPEVSIGGGYNHSSIYGNIGDYIEHVALLGSHGAAMPLLREGYSRSLIGGPNVKFSIYQKTEEDPAPKTEEVNKMEETLNKMLSRLDALEKKMMESEEGKEEEEETEIILETQAPPKEDSEMAGRVKALEKESEDMKNKLMESEYSVLKSQGFIDDTHKKNFLTMAKTNGVEFAKGVYNRKLNAEAPKGEILSEKQKEFAKNERVSFYMTRGLTKEQAEIAYNNYMEKQANGSNS